MKTVNDECIDNIGKHCDKELRICRRIEIGSVLHQGDVYLHRVSDDHPRGNVLGTRKIAIGEGVGSHHIVKGDVEVFAGTALPQWVDFHDEDLNRACLGPVVIAKEKFLLTHPRHPHHRISACVYQTTYQIDMVTRRRIED